MQRTSPSTHLAPFVCVLAALCAAGCAALGGTVMDAMLGAAKKTFLGAAEKNYGDAYHEEFDKLLGIITKPLVDKQAAEAAPAPATTTTTTTASEPASTSSTASDSSSAPAPAAVAAPVASPTSASNSVALELEVALLKQELVGGRKVPVPVQDGDTLYDAFGSHGEGDNLKLTFRVNVECYVYIMAIDSTALVQAVFPSPDYSGHANPAQPGQTYQVPEGSQWIALDSYRGIEHIYFLATRARRLDLEAQLTALAAYVRPDDPSRAGAGAELDAFAMLSVSQDAPLSRGLGKVRQSVLAGVESPQGTSAPVSSQVFGAKGDGDILVTRWFRHE